jgi:3-deoxy-7-phosphoheptulonate synthase
MKGIELTALKEKERTIVRVDNAVIGEGFCIIAGPCTVENEKQTIETARAVKEAGADMMRGGAFKPRTSPYAFQGLGLKGLKILKKAKEETGLPIVTEVIDTRDVPWVCEYADVLQIGTRNMLNSTIEEWLNCAEYILDGGNPDVVLCERGIRTFENYTRNTLDISAVPSLKELTHLPVIIDPSHASGRVSLISPLTLAAIAAGADGVIVEVHINPSEAVCDKEQTLNPGQFSEMVRKARMLHGFMADTK